MDLSSRIMNPTRSTHVPRRLSIDAIHHHGGGGGGGGGTAKGPYLIVPSIYPPTCGLPFVSEAEAAAIYLPRCWRRHPSPGASPSSTLGLIFIQGQAEPKARAGARDASASYMSLRRTDKRDADTPFCSRYYRTTKSTPGAEPTIYQARGGTARHGTLRWLNGGARRRSSCRIVSLPDTDSNRIASAKCVS